MDLNAFLTTINSSLDTLGEQLTGMRDERAEHSSRLQAVEQLLAVMQAGAGARPFGRPGTSVAALALDQVREGQHPGFAHVAGGNYGMAKITLNGTTLRAALVGDGFGTSEDGIFPADPERTGIVAPLQRRTTLLDALQHVPTERDSTEFVQLTRTGGASEQVVQGAQKAELAFNGELKTAPVITVAAWTPASRQVLDDHQALQPMLDLVLRQDCRIKLETLIVQGGTGSYSESRMAGLLEPDEHTLFVPTIAGNAPDVIGEAAVTMEINGLMPSLVVVHPLDWHRIAVTKSAVEGLYLFGNPFQPQSPTMWQLQVVSSPAVPEGTALVIDSRYVIVRDRMLPMVGVSTSHEDYFVRNLVALLGELRAGLEIRHSGAVYEVDISPSS